MSEYRELTAEEKEKIRKHVLWSNGEEGGEKADLCDANFQGADLYGADLYGADLRNAHLQNADLQGANLQNADLRNAHLQNADLHGANLRSANLRSTNLGGANLCGANLDYSCFPLWCGSIGIIADERLVAQLAFHLTRLNTNNCPEKVKEDIDVIRRLSITNKFCEYRPELDKI